MYKVAFWSSAPKSGVSTNLAAIAAYEAQRNLQKVSLVENHLDREGIGQMMLGFQWDMMVHEPGLYYSAGGSDALFEKGLTERFSRRIVDSEFVEIVEDKLRYLYQNFMTSPELFELDFSQHVLPRLNRRTRKDDSFCFFDTAPKNNCSTQEILDSADVVVVCLKQSPGVVDSFFDRYGSIMHKAVFIISDYVRRNPIGKVALASRYGIDREAICTISHSELLKNAARDGGLVGLVNGCLRPSDMDERRLRSELKVASEMIRSRIEGVEMKGIPAKRQQNSCVDERRIIVGNFGEGKACVPDNRYRRRD